jgi:hypothetical protein
MTQVEVTPLVVSDPTFDGAWLGHSFALLHAADLAQEELHTVAWGNHGIWLNRLGGLWIHEARAQCQRDEPPPRH